MAPKKPKTITNQDLLNEVQSVKGMVANQGKILKQHGNDITALQKINEDKNIADRAAKKAVAEYKAQEAEAAKKLPDNTWLTKELLSVIIKLIAVVAALIALWKVGAAGK